MIGEANLALITHAVRQPEPVTNVICCRPIGRSQMNFNGIAWQAIVKGCFLKASIGFVSHRKTQREVYNDGFI
jgi:hypothetical protein